MINMHSPLTPEKTTIAENPLPPAVVENLPTILNMKVSAVGKTSGTLGQRSFETQPASPPVVSAKKASMGTLALIVLGASILIFSLE